MEKFLDKRLPDSFRNEKIIETLRDYKGQNMESTRINDDDINRRDILYPPKLSTDAKRQAKRFLSFNDPNYRVLRNKVRRIRDDEAFPSPNNLEDDQCDDALDLCDDALNAAARALHKKENALRNEGRKRQMDINALIKVYPAHLHLFFRACVRAVDKGACVRAGETGCGEDDQGEGG